jgi:hypothetical protein
MLAGRNLFIGLERNADQGDVWVWIAQAARSSPATS